MSVVEASGNDIASTVANKLTKRSDPYETIRHAAPKLTNWPAFKERWYEFVDANPHLSREEFTYVIWQMLNREWSRGKDSRD